MPDDRVRFVCLPAIDRLCALRIATGMNWRTFGVGVVIATFMNKAGECTVSRRRIAERSGVTERNLSDEFRRLEEAGFMTTEHRDGHSNSFLLTPLPITGRGTGPTPARKRHPTPVCPDTHKEVGERLSLIHI